MFAIYITLDLIFKIIHMSLKGVVEFAVNIENFRNIDLFHQGLYHVRMCLYHLKDGQVEPFYL